MSSLENSEPLLVSTLIKSMGEMDLHAESDCFAAWLAKKQKLIHRRPKTPFQDSASLHKATKPLHYQIESIEQLEKMSSEEIDALLQKLLKNETAFIKWQENKLQLEREKKQRELKKRDAIKKRADLLLKKQAEKDAKCEKAIKAWQDEKKNELMKKTIQKVEMKTVQQKLQSERHEKSKKAFQEWLLQKKTNHLKSASEAEKKKLSSRPMWVAIELPSHKSDSYLEKDSIRKSSSSILSPPNLYNDYKVYKKYAPDFFKKYKLLVASGGVDVPLDKEVKKPQKVKKIK